MTDPRVLITGFGPFPGAPVNPTEALIRRLESEPEHLAGLGDIRTAVLPVDYQAVPDVLAELGRTHSPDIAIHFGLDAKAHGFTLERRARNEIAAGKPDNAGNQADRACIVDGGEDCSSTLPLEAIADELDRARLPWSWSDDAGGYLCNYVFYLSRSSHFAELNPALSGFIHAPPLALDDRENPKNAMSLDDLTRGARLIVALCIHCKK